MSSKHVSPSGKWQPSSTLLNIQNVGSNKSYEPASIYPFWGLAALLGASMLPFGDPANQTSFTDCSVNHRSNLITWPGTLESRNRVEKCMCSSSSNMLFYFSCESEMLNYYVTVIGITANNYVVSGQECVLRKILHHDWGSRYGLSSKSYLERVGRFSLYFFPKP